MSQLVQYSRANAVKSPWSPLWCSWQLDRSFTYSSFTPLFWNFDHWPLNGNLTSTCEVLFVPPPPLFTSLPPPTPLPPTPPPPTPPPSTRSWSVLNLKKHLGIKMVAKNHQTVNSLSIFWVSEQIKCSNRLKKI